MTLEPVAQSSLEETREEIISLTQKLDDKEKEFLISFKSGEPKWDLLGLPNINKLPAVQWKLLNISKMPRSKNEEALRELERKLN
jgi:hypothetical protein